jgi:hypothetical protein
MELVVLKTMSGLSFANYLYPSLNEKLLTNTIQNSFHLIKSFITFHHEQINEVIMEYDLIFKLEIIQALLTENEKDSFQKQSVQKVFFNLHSIVEEILKHLERIDQKINYHRSKYFSSWRRLDYGDEIKKLRKYIKLMDIRYQMFIELLKLERSTTISKLE